MKKILLALGATLAISSFAGAQKYIGSPAQDLFDQATFFLETQYFGPSKVNLGELIAKYQAELDKSCESAQKDCGFAVAEPILAQMFDDLEDPHAYYQSAAARRAEQQQATGTVNTPTPRMGFSHGAFAEYQKQIVTVGGITQGLLDLVEKGEVKFLSFDRIILNVVSGSPAEKAGFRYGDRWIGYNGTLFSSFGNIKEYGEFLAALTPKIQAREKVTFNFLRGPNKTPVNIEAVGEIINVAPFPTLSIDENNIAHLRISDYLVQGLGQQVHNLVKTAIDKNVKAIIVNMRGNGGGLGSERLISMGAFIDKPEPMRRVPRYNPERNTTEEVWLNDTGVYAVRNLQGAELSRITVRNPVLYKGPMAVLVDENCASACEYFASGVQRAKRGPVLGVPTVGIGDTNSARFGLANGGAAAMPTVRAFWPDGTPLPSRITPDVSTPDAQYKLFDTGRDIGVEGALEALGIKLSSQKSSELLRAPAQPKVPTWGVYEARQFKQPANY
ncbi:MAG: S41 family peptidase [Deinococcales bacterium]